MNLKTADGTPPEILPDLCAEMPQAVRNRIRMDIGEKQLLDRIFALLKREYVVGGEQVKLSILEMRKGIEELIFW